MNETTDAIVSDLADFLESRGGRYSLVDRNVISGQIAQRVQRWNPKETLSTTFSRALFEVADRKVEDYRNESISFTENMVKTTGPDFIDRWKLRSEQSREAGEARSNRRRNEVELEAIGKTGSREESIEPLLTRFEKFLPGSLAKEFNAWFSSLPKQNRDHLLRGLDFLEVNPDFIVSNQHLRSLIVGQRPDRKFAELRGTGDPQVRVVLSPVNVDQPRIIRSFGLRRDLDDLIRTADLRTP